ncbi:MAG TPA: DNA/RNA nuclease SfsA [Desulfobacterales bacterium]
MTATRGQRAATFTWPPLIRGTLERRYQRFLADVVLEDGRTVTAHCPNTGSMAGCCEPGRPVYISRHDDPRRKLKYTWQLIHMPGSLVGINTLVPNRLVAAAVRSGVVPELKAAVDVRPEVRVGRNSRIDLLLTDSDGGRCYVEIKNCSLVEDGRAMFPDAVTTRGRKHLQEMQTLAAAGHRCVMFYFVQRMDADCFYPADWIDPAYGAALRQAAAGGVEVLAYDTAIDLAGIRLRRRLPCGLE